MKILARRETSLFLISLFAVACGGQYEAQSQTDPLAYKNSYCDMEASCIPVCSCEMGHQCLCDSVARAQYCRAEYPDWAEHYITQGEACMKSLAAWLTCITRVSCSNVEIFLDRHPDDLNAGDPCAREYFNLECDDFEPPAEYSFDPVIIYERMDEFQTAVSTNTEIDFEDLPYDASSGCGPPMGEFISNPLDIGGVVITDPHCIQTGFCTYPTCQPDPDNPHGGNNTMGLNQGATIDFPAGTEGFLLVAEGMGDDTFSLRVTDSNGGSTDIGEQAVSFEVTYLGMLSLHGISRVEVNPPGPTPGCAGASCGPMGISAIYYGSR